MAYTQVATLTDFTSGTTIVSAEVDANFTAIRDVVNGVVTGSNTLAADTINEATSAGGVTIDSVVLKDGGATLTAALTGTTVTLGTQIEGTTANGYLDLAGDSGATVKVRVTDAGLVAIGDTTNADMTVGLTINQGANDNEALALKSSDVAHALTSYAETDTYFAVRKINPNDGGAQFRALGGTITGTVLRMDALGGAANTQKTASLASGLISVRAYQHDGAGTLANIDADGNVFSVHARVGGSVVARMLVDEDGDFYSVTAAQTFDDHDDLALLNDYDRVRSGYEGWAKENEAKLVELGVLGAPVEEGGMTNVTQLQRLLVGAVRQIGESMADMSTRLEAVERKALTP